MSSTAYVDESEPDPRVDPEVYLLAAAVVARVDAETTRVAMSSLLLPGQSKVHWNRERDRHLLLARTVLATPTRHLVVVRTRADGAPSERRRRLCLKRLLQELEALGDVSDVVLEARQAKQNERDMLLLSALRSSKEINGRLKMSHLAGPKEPLLWIPDVVVGAFGAHRQGNSEAMAVLEPQVTVHQC